MANIQVDDILAGTPAVQCKTKVRAPSARDVRDPTSRFPTNFRLLGRILQLKLRYDRRVGSQSTLDARTRSP